METIGTLLCSIFLLSRFVGIVTSCCGFSVGCCCRLMFTKLYRMAIAVMHLLSSPGVWLARLTDWPPKCRSWKCVVECISGCVYILKHAWRVIDLYLLLALLIILKVLTVVCRGKIQAFLFCGVVEAICCQTTLHKFKFKFKMWLRPCLTNAW